VTCDPAGDEISVTDGASCTIDVFDGHGLHRFQTDEMSGLSAPLDACFDASGGFALLDHGTGGARTIRKLSFLGEPLPYEPAIPREGWSPRHLALARDGHYLTVDGSGLLAKHDAATGAVLWTRELVDATWERADLLGRPAAAEDGRIYVPNAGLGIVDVVAPDGASHETFGRKGTKRGELAFPVGVAFLPDGGVLVLDQVKHTLLGFDPTHRFVDEFATFGFRPGDLYFPVGVAAARDGRVYVAQGFEGRVQVFRLEGAAATSE
jgi:DNA-binding beta-propeller fold protein YncE